MPDLPARFAAIIVAFAPLRWAFCATEPGVMPRYLLVGAILAPGKRTVTSAFTARTLRIMLGLIAERHLPPSTTSLACVSRAR